MNEPTDKSLHDWVRQTLPAYQPGYNPQDWEQMQRRLRRRRWWQRAVVAGVSLGLVVTIGWFIGLTTGPQTVQTRAKVQLPAANKHLAVSATPTKSEVTELPDAAVRAIPRAPVQAPEAGTARPVLPDVVSPIAAHSQFTNLPTTVTGQIRQPAAVAFSPEETVLKHQMLTGDFGPDSTSYQTLTRNLRQWPNAVVVCDLTSSMYPYTTQLFAWFRQNARNPAIKGLVFFTDCDSLGRQTQPGGPAGRMFVTRRRDAAGVLPLLIEAARNTVHNDDDAENDVEALLFAQQTFPEARHLILLADNLSSVKDIDRISGVTKPVHVVLCGTTGSDPAQPFQPDHFTIASRTNGSLHTLETDLNPAAISPHALLRVGTRYYRYQARKQKFRLTPFTRRPLRLGRFLWL